MSRRSRVQGRTSLHMLAGRPSGDIRPQDELHGFQGRWFCLVSAPAHLIGDKPAKMKMAKAVPGALSLVQIWQAASNDSASSRRGKRKHIESFSRPGYPQMPSPYNGWPGGMPPDSNFNIQGRLPGFDPRHGDIVEQGGGTWRNRIQTYSKALTDDDVFSEREDVDDGESDEEHGGGVSQGQGRVGQPNGGPRSGNVGQGQRNEWNQPPGYQQQIYDPSMRSMAGSNFMPGMQPPHHRWMNPFQRQGEQMMGGYPQSYGANGQGYDQRFMNGPSGPNGQADMVIGLQCQVQSLMRAVTQLQSQLSNQHQQQQHQQQRQQLHQPPPRAPQPQHPQSQRSQSREEQAEVSRGTSSDLGKSPERWPNELGQGVSGTNGNAGSFDVFSSNSFANSMPLSSGPYGTGNNLTLSSSIDLGSHSFDTSSITASSEQRPSDSLTHTFSATSEQNPDNSSQQDDSGRQLPVANESLSELL